MKKMIIALAALFMVSSASMALNEQRNDRQSNGDRTEVIKQRTDEAVKKYGLNEEQAAKLLDLNTKYADKIGPGMRRPGGGRPGNGNRRRPDNVGGSDRQQRPSGNREDFRKAFEEYNNELKGILTEDQFKAYQEDRQQRMSRGGNRGGDRRGGSDRSRVNE